MTSHLLPPVPAPLTPRKGLEFRLDPPHARFVNISIVQVNSRSFYASVDGGRERHLLQDWSSWLAGLAARGTLFLNGHPVRLPGASGPSPEERAVIRKRLRSARNIANTYAMKRLADAGERWQFEVRGGSRPYRVSAHPAWGAHPDCTCPDAVGRQSPWCKHSLAVLMSFPELRCQLLDVLMDLP